MEVDVMWDMEECSKCGWLECAFQDTMFKCEYCDGELCANLCRRGKIDKYVTRYETTRIRVQV